MEKVQKKAGRPPLNEVSKTVFLTIRVTDTQKQEIKSLAEKKGMSITELVMAGIQNQK